ncbi:MAG: bifunctional folylpolyglutamate synthase/dihydrofolate synthase, partial [Gammaproteobacteria bacterium]
CYTSPHLLRYNERIRVGGKAVSDQTICTAFDRIERARDGTSLTYFEFATLAALDIFAQQRLQVVILEVGLGGRLDAVNILDPDIALITTIDLDHTGWLGDSREQIALEKAGIMRTGKPAVFGGANPPDTLLGRATELGVDLCLPEVDFSYQRQAMVWNWQGRRTSYAKLPNPRISGEFIFRNCSAVLMALELLHESLPVNADAIRDVLPNLQIPGRFQRISGPVSVILDVAHNPEAARELAANLSQMPSEGRTMALFSALADKDISKIVEPLKELVDRWYIGEIDAERAASLEQMEEAMTAAGVAVSDISSHTHLSAAVTKAMADAETHDRLIIFGSFYTVSEMMQHPDIMGLV